jgi:Acyl dehydratase
VFVINGVRGALASVGKDLGVSEWREIRQADIDDFARITGDDNWIHVDTARAGAGPFGGTIVHGYLTLALIPRLSRSVYRWDNICASVNYGCNKVRFPAPVPVDSRVRVRIVLKDVKLSGAAAIVTFASTMEIEGYSKPCCVVENIIHVRP